MLKQLKVTTAQDTIDFQLSDYLTLICGDSGTGKTYICSLVEDWIAAYRIKNVFVVKDFQNLKTCLACKTESLLLIDKMEQYDTDLRNKACDMIYMNMLYGEPVHHYFVIMFRTGLLIPHFPDNLYELIMKKNNKSGFNFTLSPYIAR